MSENYVRDFCPNCQIKVVKDAISCNNCGSGDLIPNPYNMVEDLVEASKDYEPPPFTSTNEEELKRQYIEHDANVLRNMGYEVITPENDPLRNPNIMEPLDKMYEGEALGDEEETEEEFLGWIAGSYEEENKKEESPLQLDQNAVNALLNKQFGFLTGLAGTGKTTLINEINRLHPDMFELCATTGIAAVNLGTKTLHSTLKFFDTKSLENAWREQLLHMNLRKVRARRKNLLIDEASMLGGEQLDLICNAIDEINQDGTGKQLGLWLSGDLCQLPPVKMKYVFESDYWYQFEQNTTRLTKIWRQDNVEFMEGINLVRANKGLEAMEVFKKCGVNFSDLVNDNFEGTTLIPNNNDVDSYNEKRLRQIENQPLIRVQSKIRGKSMSEWERLIPAELRLKIGAYVMILSNDIPEFNFVNGDCGWIEEYYTDENEEYFVVKLKRNNKVVQIKRIVRNNFYDKEPEKYHYTPKFSPFQDFKTGDWVIGTISYFPLRLAYASTIHKSQGLSLDMVQINTKPPFFGYDAMGYVSISRARTPEGLFLVGKPEVIGKKITMNKKVMKYV